MNSTKEPRRPKGSLSSILNKDPEHWFAVGGEVAQLIRQEGKRKTVPRIIDDLVLQLRQGGQRHWSHRSVERAYSDFCECFPGSAPGAKPVKKTWPEVLAKMKVNPDVAREIFSSKGGISPERFRGLLLPGTEPSAEYSPRNMFKKRKVRRPTSTKKAT